MIYIILPVHNRKNITEKFIKCLVKQTYQDFKLLLIDDGSSDGTDEMVKDKVPEDKLTIIKGSGNWWWAGALQQGVNWLKISEIKPFDIILMINDDVIFNFDFLQNGVDFINANSKTLLLARSYDEEKKMVVKTGVKADLKRMEFTIADKDESINCLSTRGLFMQWNTLQNVGEFHPVLLPHYWSDYEFTLRANRKGFKLETCERVFLRASEKETGTHFLQLDEYRGVVELFKATFSKRSIPNPIYRTSFIILSSPLSDMIVNIPKTWAFTMLSFIKMAKRSLKYFFRRYQLKKTLNNMQGIRVIIGAGPTMQKGWVSTDYPLVDITSHTSMKSFFAPNTLSAMLSEHVWEHLDTDLAVQAAKNCFSFLKPGGYIRVAVPDGNHSDPLYIEQVRPGGTGEGSDDHKILYTHDSLVSLFESAGFQVRLLEWFDNDGEFHAEEWSPDDGLIMRSSRFDKRNESNPISYTSLIIDAVKLQ